MKLIINYLTSLIFLFLILGLLIPSFAVSDEEKKGDIHDSFLTCPEVTASDFSQTIQVVLPVNKIALTQATSLNVFWRPNDPLPNIRLQTDIIQRAVNEILDVHMRFFKTFPQNIELYQYPLQGGLGALYCRGYQTKDNTILLFVSPITLENPRELIRILSHELVHHWFYKTSKRQDVWLEEGVAFLIESITTSKLSGFPVIVHLDNPWTSITEPSNKIDQAFARSSRNGHVQLLMNYLYRTLGPEFVQKLLNSDKTGIASLQEAIQTEQNPYKWSSFHEAFRDFEIAKWINRMDHTQSDDILSQRYFLFPTTLKAHKIDLKEIEQEPWSSLLLDRATSLASLSKPQFTFEDYAVTDEIGLPITAEKISIDNKGKKKFIRIIFN